MQFVVTVVLIVGTAVVGQQLDYIKNKRLGYNTDFLIRMPLFAMDRQRYLEGAEFLAPHHETVKQEFTKHPNVLRASAYRWDVGLDGGGTPGPIRADGRDWQIRVQEADEDYLDTFEIPLLAGRNFRRDADSDTPRGFILNETAVKMLGWEDPIGKTIEWSRQKGPVIGVVKDHHDRALHEPIAPSMIAYRVPLFLSLAVRIQPTNVEETLAFIEGQWKHFEPTRPFQYSFVDDDIQNMYRAELRLGEMSSAATAVALLLACLGLFGLTSYATERRTREVGIRKAMGASVPDIVVLLSREFAILVVVAGVLAWSLSYSMSDSWLQRFAYRADPGAAVFAGPGVAAFVIATTAVVLQSLKAARGNPVDALRYE